MIDPRSAWISTNKGIFYTADFTVSSPYWESINTGLSGSDLNINSFTIDTFREWMYITTATGIWRYQGLTPGVATWEKRFDNEYARLHATTYGGCGIPQDSGTWNVVHCDTTGNISATGGGSGSPDCDTQICAWWSSDGLDTINATTQLNHGSGSHVGTDAHAISYANGVTVVSYTCGWPPGSDVRSARSVDHGKSFDVTNSISAFPWSNAGQHTRNGSNIWYYKVGSSWPISSSDIAYSGDDGQTASAANSPGTMWCYADKSTDRHLLEVHPADTNSLLALIASGPSRILRRSTDTGASWSSIISDGYAGGMNAIAGSQSQASVWAIAGSNINWFNSVIRVSSDNGDNWSDRTGNLATTYLGGFKGTPDAWVWKIIFGLVDNYSQNCYITINEPDSIAARYYVVLKDQTGTTVAIFDDWRSLEWKRTVNDAGSYSFSIYGNDSRASLFELDGQLEIWRSIPGAGVGWYKEFDGLHRKGSYSTDDNGETVFTSSGVDYNELLSRRIIAYKAGTITADKVDVGETVMKEFVEENMGITAYTTVVGRLVDGYMPGFNVETDFGRGLVWEGERAFENLLDVLKEVASVTNLVFQVESFGAGQFIFRVYEDQLGADRTIIGLDGTTGINAAGNSPVIFSLESGTVREISYEDDRLGEANAIVVLGDGEGSTRDTITVTWPSAADDSPWNSREVSRSASIGDALDVTNQMTIFGNETLEELKRKLTFSFTPLQQPSLLYGRDYFLGDAVTAKYGSVVENRMIVSVSGRVETDRDDITIDFSDVPYTKR